VPTDNRIREEAEDLLWRQGRKIPLPDAVIACSARRVDVAHPRPAFRLIPDVRVAHRLEDL